MMHVRGMICLVYAFPVRVDFSSSDARGCIHGTFHLQRYLLVLGVFSIYYRKPKELFPVTLYIKAQAWSTSLELSLELRFH